MRLYPVALLMAIAIVGDKAADRASALSFRTWRSAQFLDSLRDGHRVLTLTAFELQHDALAAARDVARSASRNDAWLLIAALFGYLFVSRESWRFRLAVFGVILVFEVGLSAFGVVY